MTYNILVDKRDILDSYKGWWIVQWDGRGRWYAYSRDDGHELFDCGFESKEAVKAEIDDL